MDFWDSFKGVVSSKPSLSVRDKFKYLRDSSERKAKKAVAGFRLTKANYKMGKKMLKNWFGRDEKISKAHCEDRTKSQPIYSDRGILRVL